MGCLGFGANKHNLESDNQINLIRTLRKQLEANMEEEKSQNIFKQNSQNISQNQQSSINIEVQDSNVKQQNSKNKKNDYKQYTFAPLLLFSKGDYFDKGYSNYNSVEDFFKNQIKTDLLTNVIYERKNMKYDELVLDAINNKSLVICCIDAHFTAIKVLNDSNVIRYDPLSTNITQYVGDQSVKTILVFFLMKCKYADQQHIVDNKDYYTGSNSDSLKQLVYKTWKNLADLTLSRMYLKEKDVEFPLQEYLFINNSRNPQNMSKQATGNTCYFQVYLFAVLCRVCEISIQSNKLVLNNIPRLKEVSIIICKFLNEFYLDSQGVYRPLTNNNFILDFYQFSESPYYSITNEFLARQGIKMNYEQQYNKILDFYEKNRVLQIFNRYYIEDQMSCSLNTKQLQLVNDTQDGHYKLCGFNYYKYRSATMLFGFHANIMRKCNSFCEFNSLRKNFLISVYEEIKQFIKEKLQEKEITKYKEYFFMPQFEVGQKELVDIHFYTFLLEQIGSGNKNQIAEKQIQEVNKVLRQQLLFSTQKQSNFEKIMPLDKFIDSGKFNDQFLRYFLTLSYFQNYVSLGLNEFNPKEKEINCLTRNILYDVDLMKNQMFRQEFEFERECINQMAKSCLTNYNSTVQGQQNINQKYEIIVHIGVGLTYNKYNTLFHYLNILDEYWQNPDINQIQIFGKDIRTLLCFISQKIIFSKNHDYIHYGHVQSKTYNSGYYSRNSQNFDLLLGDDSGSAIPYVTNSKRDDTNQIYVTDKIYEFDYIRTHVEKVVSSRQQKLKTDDIIINLCLLNLLLDFGLYDKYYQILNLEFLQHDQIHFKDKKQLQVQISNMINEQEKKNKDLIQRIKIENLVYKCSYKFLVNKNFDMNSDQFKLINQLNSDKSYYQYVLLCKIYLSLCQINKSVELDYYKIKCDNDYKIIIPSHYSNLTSLYLDKITTNYNFYEKDQIVCYDEMKIFDLSYDRPQVQLFRIRLNTQKEIESMYRYIEFANTFITLTGDQVLIFIAGNILKILSQQKIQLLGQQQQELALQLNEIPVQMASVYVNLAISFIPCLKYEDSNDIILLTSTNIIYHVDTAGQFNENYYGMKYELIELIRVELSYCDANDQQQFKQYPVNELLMEQKMVLYAPYYLLQIHNKKEIYSLLDYSLKLRNVSLFSLLMFFLYRVEISVTYDLTTENKKKKVTGPWMHSLKYVIGNCSDTHYDEILKTQFFEINDHRDLNLTEFIDVLCENFIKYQQIIDGKPQIIPTQKQKNFIKQIITAEQSFYFSEVGSGKTKVILPLLCQMFLSNNTDTHQHLSKNNQQQQKNILFIIVPEHMVFDAQHQVYRYCLNLQFREKYYIYDDVYNIKHNKIDLTKIKKMIFISSFNQFKKALTDDEICEKIKKVKDNILLIIDEVDDFLDRDKLVFNICQNKNNEFESRILEFYYTISHSVYNQTDITDYALFENQNLTYWKELSVKFRQINEEIKQKSKSINKSFGIFNEFTLKHCSTNISHDIEGYKSLIARPYESVNRAMPGSYYSDVERTIYLTYYILMEDLEKYDELFQQERKFITFEYYNEYIKHLDYDELIYGDNKLSQLASQYPPQVKIGLTKYLYEIILKKMEIQDKSRSVNSIDVIFNFDCKGFTGTPFIDNYPTYQYIKNNYNIKSQFPDIPDLIDRSFYLHSNNKQLDQLYKQKFIQFQGANSNVIMNYQQSQFIQTMEDEEELFEMIFTQQLQLNSDFNCIVDLAGVFKKISIQDIRNIIKKKFGNSKFNYIYHIDQTNCSDRILYLNSDNDVQYDEEFYRNLAKNYHKDLNKKVFFFIDNRNVTGKDVPFQLIYKNHYNQPLIYKSIIIAHDVDDFSKIWQAMGRSRTMNMTQFTIYKTNIEQILSSTKQNNQQQLKKQLSKEKDQMEIEQNNNNLQKQSSLNSDYTEMKNMQNCDLTKALYIKNCDSKVTGNLSSIYQTLISIYNLSKSKFYYENEIINTFILKMNKTINKLMKEHDQKINNSLESRPSIQNIFRLILADKFRINDSVQNYQLEKEILINISTNIIQQKFEQRKPSGDIYDEIIYYLQGEQKDSNLNELSYTKQQQKQKQQQHNKNQDNDVMQTFDSQKTFNFSISVDDYYLYTQLKNKKDDIKRLLSSVIFREICIIQYKEQGQEKFLRVYPTIQFLYSNFINPNYIDSQTKTQVSNAVNKENSQEQIINNLEQIKGTFKKMDKQMIEKYKKENEFIIKSDMEEEDDEDEKQQSSSKLQNQKVKNELQKIQSDEFFQVKVYKNFIRQNPQFTLLYMGEGVFIIGMKNQFNKFDIQNFPLCDQILFMSDESGHILYQKQQIQQQDKLQESAYSLALYIFLEQITKQEMSANVLTYYQKYYSRMQQSVNNYSENKGSGFICWRFIFDQIPQESPNKKVKKISQNI